MQTPTHLNLPGDRSRGDCDLVTPLVFLARLCGDFGGCLLHGDLDTSRRSMVSGDLESSLTYMSKISFHNFIIIEFYVN